MSISLLKYSYDKFFDPSLKPLINATGVILHTNMGRSLISHKILNDASKVICNYSNFLVTKLQLGNAYASIR
ncbi:MAG: hypothetical protein JJV95_02805 [Sulfurospirillum sp.]|nr:hypothetical protein [Sulfurospirillum sp.]MBL0702901.1 hypothetical protein [Sulfurospirillum sp.]